MDCTPRNPRSDQRLSNPKEQQHAPLVLSRAKAETHLQAGGVLKCLRTALKAGVLKWSLRPAELKEAAARYPVCSGCGAVQRTLQQGKPRSPITRYNCNVAQSD